MTRNQVQPILHSLVRGSVAGLVAALLASALLDSVDGGAFGLVDSRLNAYVFMILGGAVMGSGFGLLVRRQRHGFGENLFWGMSYGVFWWVLGQLTILPLLLGGSFAWDLASAQSNLPGLIGLLVFGGLTGLFLALLNLGRAVASKPSLGGLVRGVLVGLAAGRVLGGLLDAQDHLVPMAAMMEAMPEQDQQLAAWIIILFIGGLAGLIYATLYPKPDEGAGVSAIRGVAYGFVWWSLGAITLLPLMSGQAIGWSLEQVQVEFPTLPGFMLFGALLTILYRWVEGFVATFLSSEVNEPQSEGIAVQFIRALGRGAAAGVVGGLVFTAVMVRIGFLPRVATLIGAGSAQAGLLAHFSIAVLIGMSYGLLFRRQSFDLASGLGWGMAYGFLWWILGALTLMPIFLGGRPQWSALAAANSFPALVGHLGYGASLGVVFYLLEARDLPWWLSRSQSEAKRIASRQELILSSAPALWVLVVMIALILPVLLGSNL